jgi:hypothetical protein
MEADEVARVAAEKEATVNYLKYWILANIQMFLINRKQYPALIIQKQVG